MSLSGSVVLGYLPEGGATREL